MLFSSTWQEEFLGHEVVAQPVKKHLTGAGAPRLPHPGGSSSRPQAWQADLQAVGNLFENQMLVNALELHPKPMAVRWLGQWL